MVTHPVTLAAGEQSLQVNMGSLQKGSYIIKLKLGGKISTQMVNKF
jgi:hypothetical protein